MNVYRTMAKYLLRQKTNSGRFPIKTISQKIVANTATHLEITKWYPHAIKLIRKGKV